MAVKIPKSTGGGEYTPIDKKVYQGVIASVVLIGTHETTYNNETRKRTQVIVGYELPTVEREDKDGNKYNPIIREFYTLSLDDRAKLYPVVEAALGTVPQGDELDDFELSSIIGKNVNVTIDHKQGKDGKTRDYVKTVGGVVDGTPIFELKSKPVSFDFEMVKADGTLDIPEGVSDWVKGRIYESDEYKEMAAKAMNTAKPTVDSSPEDEIPMDYPTTDEAPAEEAEAEEAPASTGETLADKIAALEATLPDSVPEQVKKDLIANLIKMEG